MLTSTTPTIAGREITETLGVVTGEAIVGANIFRDLLAGITDIVGGRSRAYESALRDAREIALKETMGVCHTVKRAYEIATFLGEISKPDSNYRKVLETIKVKGAYTLSQIDGPQSATIVKVKHY